MAAENSRNDYDARMLPLARKAALTIGMAMTEKQGGSDVRANTTRAEKISDNEYRLTGHKWFCSAPMSDAFLTLAQTANGLTCFLVPRWQPDDTRNHFFIQRLKDKFGNRSNASSEIEYSNTFAQRIGEEGHGVRTILEMVHHTRLDTCLAAAALMRQAFVQAAHHATLSQRIRQALDRAAADAECARRSGARSGSSAVADAAHRACLRRVRAIDDSAAPFARIAVAIGKYWVNKRTPNLVYEAMECLGGAGYVEESMLPRLYREAPLNSIWEGSGNVICLDVLRAIAREPDSINLLFAEIGDAVQDKRIAHALGKVKGLLAETVSWNSRRGNWSRH